MSDKDRTDTITLIAIALQTQLYARLVTFCVIRMSSSLIKEIFKLNRNVLNK